MHDEAPLHHPLNDRVQIVSVNVGGLAPLSPETPRKRSGIRKRPVQVPVAVGRLGLTGDRVGNRTHHGGPDQALYLYSAQDSAWWSAELGIPCEPGCFGENLTIDRWWDTPRIGDRLQVGGVLLELTAPRIPCNTLATRMGMPAFVKRFADARRPGAYVRVIAEGDIVAGVSGHVLRVDRAFPTLAVANAIWFETPRDRDVMRALLDAPVAERYRAALLRWLER